MRFGSMPRDGGNLILTEAQRDELVAIELVVGRWIRPHTGAQELLDGERRYCLWLVDASPADLRALLRVSSERRAFVPMGFVGREVAGNDQVLMVPDATMLHFGVLSSTLHNAWVRCTCGRLKSDYRHSKDIVHDNFPWPESPIGAQRAKIEAAAQGVLDARADSPDASLADLYDPLTMPPALLEAHQVLDAAVDAAYGRKGFKSDAERVAFLVELYRKCNSLLPPATDKPRRVPRSPHA
jgi:hypothetical protein